MRRTVPLVALLAIIGCKKKETDAPPATAPTGSAAMAAPAPEPTAPAPTPAAPPPTPVKLTADELKPTCAKIITAELAAKTHGATEVKDETPRPGALAICSLHKGADQVGSVTLACNPDLDTSLIERERAAMTKAKDMTPPIGRGGYRLSNMFTFNDDETPCRIQVTFVELPADDVWPDALRAIVAAVNPGTLK
jgi:hypothetical protein